jgi:hypothetical protein
MRRTRSLERLLKAILAFFYELAAWENWALDYANRVDPVLSGQILSHVRMPKLN